MGPFLPFSIFHHPRSKFQSDKTAQLYLYVQYSSTGTYVQYAVRDCTYDDVRILYRSLYVSREPAANTFEVQCSCTCMYQYTLLLAEVETFLKLCFVFLRYVVVVV